MTQLRTADQVKDYVQSALQLHAVMEDDHIKFYAEVTHGVFTYKRNGTCSPMRAIGQAFTHWRDIFEIALAADLCRALRIETNA